MKALDLILLIEDDETVNFYNEFLLKEIGATNEIRIAKNGKEGLEYFEKCDAGEDGYEYPDLVLLDINMPVMNGFQFLEAYEQRPEAQRSKALIVMLTTSLHPKDKERANGFSTVSDYLYKPLLKEMIEEVIGEYFEA